MIYAIRAYGDPILRKKAKEIDPLYPDLNKLIENMFETMYDSDGVGLAAPQIGIGIRLFVVDASPFVDDKENTPEENKNLKKFVKVFINPVLVEEKGNLWKFEEGCLSIPKIKGDIERHEELTISYFDENWNKKTETFNGIPARIIQHEYDHLEGKLFIDLLSSLKKKLIQAKLKHIAIGNIDTNYKMKFFKIK